VEDPDIVPVLEQIKSGREPSDDMLMKLGSTSQAIMVQYPLLDVVDGCLYLRSSKLQYQAKPRVILPASLVSTVCQKFHIDPNGKHLHRFRTELKIRQQFWRPGLKGMVANFIKTCPKCQPRADVIEQVITSPSRQVKILPKSSLAVSSSMDIPEGKEEGSIVCCSSPEELTESVSAPSGIDLEALKVKYLKRASRICKCRAGCAVQT
jgi:hypothetical protein